MIRKLVMWQTNKESDGEHYPAFVVHYTDFSPNRKTPLEREIRISSSRQQIDDLWKELEAEAFTKGWTSSGSGGTPAAQTAVTPAAAPAAKKKASPKKSP